MDPYTRPGGRKKTLGLSAKEYTEITGTIASVRRQNRLPGHDIDDEPASSHISREGHSRDQENESSFIAETSFVLAPLNSRVVSTSSVPKKKGKEKLEPLDRVPLEIQEAMILEDLLHVLMGIEGAYVTFHPDYSPEDDDPLQGIRFVVSPSLDSSLRDLVERVLPLGMYYTAIFAFVEHRSHLDYGLVNHALCAAIRDMLKDYQTLLSQLEHAFNTSPLQSLALRKVQFPTRWSKFNRNSVPVAVHLTSDNRTLHSCDFRPKGVLSSSFALLPSLTQALRFQGLPSSELSIQTCSSLLR